MTLLDAIDLADQVTPPPQQAGEALRVLRDMNTTLMHVLRRVREAAGAPRDMSLLDMDQVVSDLRRKAEGKS